MLASAEDGRLAERWEAPIKYNQPFDQPSNPEAPYIDGNPAAGIQGSIVPAAAVEFPQRELVNFTLDSRIYAPANTDMHQLARSVQSGMVNFGVDTGIPNALATVLIPPLLGYFDGLRVFVRAAYRNTGRATLAIGGLGAREVIRFDGKQLKDGDILPGAVQGYAYDAVRSKWQLMNASIGGLPYLQQNLTIYVNYGIGDDANDGISNTVGHALKTLQGAFNLAFSYPPSQFTITIIIADDNRYPGAITPYWAGPNINVIGNVAAPQNVVITGQNNHAIALYGINTMIVQGVSVATTVGAQGPAAGFVAANAATMYVENCRSYYCQGAVFEAFGGNLSISTHTFAGNAGELYWAVKNGNLSFYDGAKQQIIAGPITVGNTALATQNGSILLPPGWPVFVNPGNVTGRRYFSDGNGVIFVNGAPAGINFFPGTAAGLTDHGGQYY